MAESALDEVASAKVGKFPAWAIGLLMALVFVVGYTLYKRRTNKALDTTAAIPPDPALSNDAIDPSTGLPYSVEPGGYGNAIDPATGLPVMDNPDYPVGLTAQGTPSPHTNVQWSRLAFDEIIAKGDDPSLVSNALTKYLSGSTLSAAEQGVVNLALQMFGAPPEGLLPVDSPTGTSPGGVHQVPTPDKPTVVSVIGDTVTLAVKPVPGATVYEWNINGSNHDHTTLPKYTYHLAPKTTYELSVSAHIGTASSAVSPSVTVTTK